MKRRGFTIIEILVVMAIIAILVAILLPVLSNARRHVNEAKCQTQLVQYSHAIESYRQDTGAYPPQSNVSLALRQAKKLSEILTCPLDPKKKDNSDTYSKLYNYYGYQEDNARQPIVYKTRAEAGPAYTAKTTTTIAGALYWRSEGGAYGSPDSDFPGLLNTNPPPNTIVTICPNHILNKGRYMILRIDGSVDFAAPTSNTFWMLSEKINK